LVHSAVELEPGRCQVATAACELVPSLRNTSITSIMSSITCQIIDKQSGDVLHTLSHNGQQYVVTEAGTEFEVKVRLDNRTGQEHKVQ
jgi:hypothetical protein